MGTRADFYKKKPDQDIQKEDWIASIAWDGYPEGIDDDVLNAKTEEEYDKALEKFLRDRDDVTYAKDGWPWPWNDSETTDCQYVFDKDKVVCCDWDDNYKFPDMSSMKRVAMGSDKSGVIIIQGK